MEALGVDLAGRVEDDAVRQALAGLPAVDLGVRPLAHQADVRVGVRVGRDLGVRGVTSLGEHQAGDGLAVQHLPEKLAVGEARMHDGACSSGTPPHVF